MDDDDGRGDADDPAGGSLLTEIHKKEKRLKLLIIIPAYNEDESIERVVDNLIKIILSMITLSLMTDLQTIRGKSVPGEASTSWICR